MRVLLILACTLGFLAPRASPQTRNPEPKCAPVRFSGEVARNQKYVHALPRNLEFRLLPSPEGWSISIGRPGDRNEDFVSITPPYHGMLPSIIEAWHFRNADNTGPNEGDVNAPDETRFFWFVMNEAQYKKFSDGLDLWSGATEKERNEGERMLQNAPRRKGVLNIVDMELGGLGKGNRPFFQLMKFSVDLCFPPPVEAPSQNGNAAKSEPPKQNP